MPDNLQQRVIIGVTLLIAGVYLLGTAYSSGLSRPVVQGDARSYFAYLPSIMLDGDLDLTNQFDVLRPEGGDPRYPFGVGAEGYAANPFPIGPALLWLPGYVVGLALDRGASALGFDTGPTGYGLFAAWGAALAAIVWAGIGAELSRRLAREVVATRYALPAALAIWCGTPALYYTMVAPLYSHAVAWFAAALALWAGWQACKRPDDTWRWLAVGAAGGLLVSIRLQDAPILLVPAGLALLTTSGLPAARTRCFAALGIGGLLGYLPQAYTWWALHGEIVPRQGLGSPAPFTPTRLMEVLFSTGYEGWLSWTPVAAVGIVGLWLVARGPFPTVERSVALSGLVAIAGLVIVDVIHPYGQGAAFGARRYVTVTPLLVIGTAGAIAWCVGRPRLERRGPIAIGLLTLAGLWLFVAYELLILRHGVYGNLTTTWRYALGLWSG